MVFWGTSFLRQYRLQADAMVTFLKGVKVGVLFELLAKLLAASLEKFDVRLAVRLHFGLQYKMVIGVDFLLVPLLEFRFLLGGHAIGIVRVSGRHGSFVVLVFQGVEFVREKCQRWPGNWREETVENTRSL